MAYTTAQLDTIIASLEVSMAAGYAEVTFDGRRIVYKSTEQIMKALTYFKGLLNQLQTSPRSRIQRVRTSKGL